MTDILSEAYGRALVERTAFVNESVWLPLLAVHHMNAKSPVIRDKTFTDCRIEGPAVIALVDGVSFDGCDMGAATVQGSLFYKGQGPVLTGAVVMENVKFVRCRFVQVGFTGHPTTVDTMVAELTAARAAADKGQG
ncbi:hypothetical protein BH09PSE1_BH09PSE1_26010 [soil metagenome]